MNANPQTGIHNLGQTFGTSLTLEVIEYEICYVLLIIFSHFASKGVLLNFVVVTCGKYSYKLYLSLLEGKKEKNVIVIYFMW